MAVLLTILKDGLAGGLCTMLRIALFLIPIMVLVEIARHYKILEMLSRKLKRVLNLLTLPLEAAFPLLVGLCFGIVYGSALIIDYAREGSLGRRDLLLIGIFLSISHSLIEDTLIFAAFGANPLLIILIRFSLAFLITRMAAWGIDLLSGKSEMRHSRKGENMI